MTGGRALPVVSGCELGDDQLGAQLARYATLGAGARLLRRTAHELVVQLSDDVNPGTVEETIGTERRCCAFFTIGYNLDRRRLTIAVSDDQHAAALATIHDALGVPAQSP